MCRPVSIRCSCANAAARSESFMKTMALTADTVPRCTHSKVAVVLSSGLLAEEPAIGDSEKRYRWRETSSSAASARAGETLPVHRRRDALRVAPAPKDIQLQAKDHRPSGAS